MNYEFSLSGKQTVVLLFGLGVTGILLLLAGFLIGYKLHPSTLPAAGQVQNAGKAKLAPAAVVAKAVSFTKPLQPTSSGGQSQAGSGNQTRPPANISSPVAAAASNAPVDINAGASEAPNASAPPQASDPSGEAYAIQVGAFLDADKAALMVKHLKDLGYNATIFKATDAEGRVWEAVRLGEFSDLPSALHAAAEFTTKEQMFAVVRPTNAL
jgi:cell division septation protein DedD